MNDPKAPRPSRQPLMDALGQMCADGKETAEYLWQVPKDAAARQKILDLLTQIGTESAKQGRKEMPKLVEELKIAAQATPSPRQVELLVDGFDRHRFVLSAGHACMLLYSVLYLTGYDLTLDDIRQFRQWGSRTPGHSEHGVTPGVEAT